MQIPFLDPANPQFPDPETALADPDGLLAVGGNLAPQTLLKAYRSGIFPWFDRDPILWWSPSERAVIPPLELHLSRSMRKVLKQSSFSVTLNQNFSAVIAACAAPRGDQGTWITPQMQRAYAELHRLGYAQSIEVWQGGNLVGGLYGLSVGTIFCGESMFNRIANGSKIALFHLAWWCHVAGFRYIDCQLENPHLSSLGVPCITRRDFLRLLSENSVDLSAGATAASPKLCSVPIDWSQASLKFG